MTTYDIANGVAVLLAVNSASSLPKGQRGPALGLVSLFAANWLLYVTSWLPNPPASFFWSHGLMVRSDDIWALMDALTAVGAVACAVMTAAIWPWLIYVLSLVQIVCHVLYWDMAYLPEAVYYSSLDWLFWGQIAVFLLAGGRSVKDRLIGLRGLRWLGRFAGKAADATGMVARP